MVCMIFCLTFLGNYDGLIWILDIDYQSGFSMLLRKDYIGHGLFKAALMRISVF